MRSGCSTESIASRSDIVGVGVAVPGLVGTDGVLRRVPNLPGWDSVPVAEAVQSALAMPVEITLVDNEANLAALAEHWYSEADVGNDFVRVSGEIGVGAGIVTGGELWRGVNGLSGELGHVTVEPDGPVCSCGARGCLEQLAGQEALLREAGAAMPAGTALGVPDGPIADLVARAQAGNEQTLGALRRGGAALGTALSSLVNVLDIPTIVLGGLYAEVAPWISADVESELSRPLGRLPEDRRTAGGLPARCRGRRARRGRTGHPPDHRRPEPDRRSPAALTGAGGGAGPVCWVNGQSPHRCLLAATLRAFVRDPLEPQPAMGEECSSSDI